MEMGHQIEDAVVAMPPPHLGVVPDMGGEIFIRRLQCLMMPDEKAPHPGDRIEEQPERKRSSTVKERGEARPPGPPAAAAGPAVRGASRAGPAKPRGRILFQPTDRLL